MEYDFKKKVENYLEQSHRTKKSLYEHLRMTPQGFDSMMKNNSFSASRLALIASFFNVSVSEFYDDMPKDSALQSSFGEQVVKKMADDIGQLRHFFEEEIKVKNQQIAGLQRMLESVLGKFEGAIVEPLSTGDSSFDQAMQDYKTLVLDTFAPISSVRSIIPDAKLVAPRSHSHQMGNRLQ